MRPTAPAAPGRRWRCRDRRATPTAPATRSTRPSPERSRRARAWPTRSAPEPAPAPPRWSVVVPTARPMLRHMTDHADRTARYAELIVRVGANVQPGQTVLVNGHVEHAPFARALAEAAYARGARYVDIWYWDPHAKRSRLQHAPLHSLAETPAWLDERARAAVDGGAYIRIEGDPNPTVLADVDPERAKLDPMPVNQVIRQ